MKLQTITYVILLLFCSTILYARKKNPKEHKVHHAALSSSIKNGPHAVVPRYSGGRLGDNLVAFSHALCFSLANNVELLLASFPYSESLRMSDVLRKLETVENQFSYRSIYYGGAFPTRSVNEKTLFIIPYFPESFIEYTGRTKPSFMVDWEDKEFIKQLRELLTPKDNLTLLSPPKEKISIALHVRKGGSWNNEHELSFDVDRLCVGNLIYKIPLDSYYVEQIKLVAELFQGQPLYVFLFTDDRNPQELMERYKAMVNIPTIEFDCRKGNHDHFYNVLEDFFSMMNFDVLIRPESNFSIMAEKLGDYSVIISPGSFSRNTKTMTGLMKLKKPINNLRTH